jgi:hypothetical protein
MALGPRKRLLFSFLPILAMPFIGYALGGWHEAIVVSVIWLIVAAGGWFFRQTGRGRYPPARPPF